MHYKVFWAAKHQKQFQPSRTSQIIFSVKIPKNTEELPCLSRKLRQSLATKQNAGGVWPKPSKHVMAPIHWWWQIISCKWKAANFINIYIYLRSEMPCIPSGNTVLCVYVCICDAQHSSVSLHWQRLKKKKNEHSMVLLLFLFTWGNTVL